MCQTTGRWTKEGRLSRTNLVNRLIHIRRSAVAACISMLVGRLVLGLFMDLLAQLRSLIVVRARAQARYSKSVVVKESSAGAATLRLRIGTVRLLVPS